MTSIAVIKHHIGVMADGRKVSPFSAGCARIEATGKWTWLVTDHDGSQTTGMCRVPVATREEAIAIANRVAAVTGAEVKA